MKTKLTVRGFACILIGLGLSVPVRIVLTGYTATDSAALSAWALVAAGVCLFIVTNKGGPFDE